MKHLKEDNHDQDVLVTWKLFQLRADVLLFVCTTMKQTYIKQKAGYHLKVWHKNYLWLAKKTKRCYLKVLSI